MGVKIGFNKNTSISKKDIEKYFSNNKTKVTKENYDIGYIFNIIPSKSRLSNKKGFQDDLSKMILDMILKEFSKELIAKKINYIGRGFSQEVREEVVGISKKILLDEKNFILEKEDFNSEIGKYLLESDFILLDGFIRFRLKKLNSFMDLVISRSIAEYKSEKEFREFINVLKYFVESQESKYNLINIIFKNDDYELLNEEGNIIDREIFNQIVREIDSVNLSKDDLLISSLIVVAPKKIIIHINEEYKDKNVIKIITNVFKDRVYFCFRCSKCSRDSEKDK